MGMSNSGSYDNWSGNGVSNMHSTQPLSIDTGLSNARSVPMGDIVSQVRALVEKGFKEVVITGVDITDYGKDLPGAPTLGQMLKRLLALVPEHPKRQSCEVVLQVGGYRDAGFDFGPVDVSSAASRSSPTTVELVSSRACEGSDRKVRLQLVTSGNYGQILRRLRMTYVGRGCVLLVVH